jgi:hypothetical protein
MCTFWNSQQIVEKMGNRQIVEKMGNRQIVEKMGNRQMVGWQYKKNLNLGKWQR